MLKWLSDRRNQALLGACLFCGLSGVWLGSAGGLALGLGLSVILSLLAAWLVTLAPLSRGTETQSQRAGRSAAPLLASGRPLVPPAPPLLPRSVKFSPPPPM